MCLFRSLEPCPSFPLVLFENTKASDPESNSQGFFSKIVRELWDWRQNPQRLVHCPQVPFRSWKNMHVVAASSSAIDESNEEVVAEWLVNRAEVSWAHSWNPWNPVKTSRKQSKRLRKFPGRKKSKEKKDWEFAFGRDKKGENRQLFEDFRRFLQIWSLICKVTGKWFGIRTGKIIECFRAAAQRGTRASLLHFCSSPDPNFQCSETSLFSLKTFATPLKATPWSTPWENCRFRPQDDRRKSRELQFRPLSPYFVSPIKRFSQFQPEGPKIVQKTRGSKVSGVIRLQKRLFFRGRHGGVEKRGGWKTSRMTPLPKRGFGPPLVRYVFHPSQVSVLCFFLYKNPRQSRPEALLEGSKSAFGRARSLVRFPPPIRFCTPHIMAQVLRLRRLFRNSVRTLVGPLSWRPRETLSETPARGGRDPKPSLRIFWGYFLEITSHLARLFLKNSLF